MKSEKQHSELALKLQELVSDFVELRSATRGLDACGYDGLLAGVSAAVRAQELRNRAARLFAEAASALPPTTAAHNVRTQLLETSVRLAAFTTDGAPKAALDLTTSLEAQWQKPVAGELFTLIDGICHSEDGVGLHDRVLSIATATIYALYVWRTPPLKT